MTLILEKSAIPQLLESLTRKYQVIDYRGEENFLPAKIHFLPAKEKLFTYFFSSRKTVVPPLPKKKTLLFGLNPVDLEALDYLDEIMGEKPADYFYERRRKNILIVGLSEHSLAVPAPAGDLMLEKINEKQYRVFVLSKQGAIITNESVFQKEKNPEIINYPAEKNDFRELLKDSELLAAAILWSRELPIWNELEKQCLACGICSYVCPLCYCFSMGDQAELDGCSACRFRRWDACTLNNFSQIAGGKNFHPRLKNRYFNWFFHKFVRAYQEFGKAQCVACGRCQKFCPAGIDIYKVLSKIIEDYKCDANIRIHTNNTNQTRCQYTN